VKFKKFPMASEMFSEIRGKSETEGNASLPQGGWTPLSERFQVPENIGNQFHSSGQQHTMLLLAWLPAKLWLVVKI